MMGTETTMGMGTALAIFERLDAEGFDVSLNAFQPRELLTQRGTPGQPREVNVTVSAALLGSDQIAKVIEISQEHGAELKIDWDKLILS
jgi:hypothetical protein